MPRKPQDQTVAELRLGRLRAAGVTPTIQRLAILECLEETRDHPTADVIYDRVRKVHPTIARATVFNTLDALTKAGAILRLTIDPTAARYDADLDPHVHFRCRVCGQLFDFHNQPNRRLKNVDGHRVETIRTYAYGVCSDCLQEANHAGGSEQQKTKGNDTAPTRKNGSKRPSASDGNASQQKKAKPASASDSASRREVE